MASINELIATNDGTEDAPSYSVTDQDGEFIFDCDTLSQMMAEAKKLAEYHSIEKLSILL